VPRKYFRKFLPSHQSIRENRLIRLFGPVLHRPNLWHLHRRSVAGGVAVGLFTGLFPGPVQMLSAAIGAVIFRVNLPVAVFTTFYTNPFTFVPLYFVAYKIGSFVTGQSNNMPDLRAELKAEGMLDWFPALFHWVASMGKPLLIGVPILGVVLALGGYFLVRGLWRLHVVLQWRRRGRKRHAT